jgi:hypothetical protein
MDTGLKDVHSEVCEVQNNWADSSAKVTCGCWGIEQLRPTVLVYRLGVYGWPKLSPDMFEST